MKKKLIFFVFLALVIISDVLFGDEFVSIYYKDTIYVTTYANVSVVLVPVIITIFLLFWLISFLKQNT